MEGIHSRVRVYDFHTTIIHSDFRLGATLPHGMVKAGMDTDSPGNVRPVPEPKEVVRKLISNISTLATTPTLRSM